jgi:hypothetical protein
MSRRTYKFAWLAVIIAFMLACNLMTGLTEDVPGIQGTAGAAATQARALASQAQGLATSVEESGFLKTARALATEEGGQFLVTARTLATEAEDHGLIKTARAFATEEGSNLLATARGVATQGVQAGSAPSDIPIMGEETLVNFLGSESLVTYLTSMPFRDVLDFYKQEMPANDWEPASAGNLKTDTIARLIFNKSGRRADITINVNPLDQNTLVTILIRE